MRLRAVALFSVSLLFPFSVCLAAPIGWFDSISSGVATGWTFDNAATSTNLTVQFYMNGPVGSGTFAGQTVTNVSRPDVNAGWGISGNVGFSWQIPSSDLTSAHTWYAYALPASLTPGGSSGAPVQLLYSSSPSPYTTPYTNSVNASTPVTFTANPSSGNSPLSVTFSASGSSLGSGDTVNFGDNTGGSLSVSYPPCAYGTTCSAQGTASHTYQSPGNYTATLYGPVPNCPAGTVSCTTPILATATVTVTAPSYNPTFTATSPASGIAPFGVNFNVTNGSNNDLINFGDGTQAAVNGVNSNTTHTYQSPGNYTATLEQSNGTPYPNTPTIAITVSGGSGGGDASVTDTFKNSPVVVTASGSQYAGAIYSITWNGVQFLDHYDHGREMASAASFNGWGECFNPTEPGSADDSTGPTSTSQLQSISTQGTSIFTKSLMAFWLAPGEADQQGPSACDGVSAIAKNTTKLSNYSLAKTVTLGADGMPNVIENNITFGVPEARTSGTFEAPTGYMPPSFSSFYTYDPRSQKLAPITTTSGGIGLPVIFATSNGSEAMGVYSPQIALQNIDPATSGGLYLWDNFGSVVKWDCAFRAVNLVPGNYNYICYTSLGSLSDVESAIQKLYTDYPPAATVPDGAFDGVSASGAASGWALDSNALSENLTVQFYMDGPLGTGTLAGQTVANSSRPDVDSALGVTGNYGFVWQIPSQDLTSVHTWYAYALSPPTNVPTQLPFSSTPNPYQNTVSASGNSLPLNATASNSTTDYLHFPVYSFALPSPVNMTGLSGSLSINSAQPTFSEALIGVYDVPSGACPANGSIVTTFPSGAVALGQFMVKGAGTGTFSLPVSFVLPQSIPISGCVMIFFSGANLGSGTLTMTSNLALSYNTAPAPSPAASWLGGADDEYCFGTPNTNCGVLSTPNTDATDAFARFTVFNSPTQLIALSGDVSDAAMNLSPFYSAPSGSWSMQNNFYIYHGSDCSQFPKAQWQYGNGGYTGPGNYFTSVPADATLLLSVPLSGSGDAALQQSVFKTFTNTVLEPGDCLVHLVSANASNGTIDAESQVGAYIEPAASTQSSLLTGWIDATSSSYITGWALDQSAPTQAITVKFYLDGPESSGTYLGSTQTTIARPDVNTAYNTTGTHGYSFSFPASVSNGTHTIYAYAVSASGGSDAQLNGSPASVIVAPSVTLSGPAVQELVDSPANGYTYGYGPSIIDAGGTWNMYYCSTGSPGWDDIRHATSADGIHWSAPDIVLQASDLVNERSTCDPSVVYFNGYYYLFYTGNQTNVQGVNLVARSSSPDGPFLKLTNEGTWVQNATDPKIILSPIHPAPDGGPNDNPETWYGLGQPSVVVKGGVLYQWFTDTTRLYPNAQENDIYLATSTDPTSWSTRVQTNVIDGSVDVKYDAATNQFVMFSFDLTDSTVSDQVVMRTSTDGITWSNPMTILPIGSVPEFANNIGVSGDTSGNLMRNFVLVGYGAPYGLAGALSWGRWSLYGQDITSLVSQALSGSSAFQTSVPAAATQPIIFQANVNSASLTASTAASASNTSNVSGSSSLIASLQAELASLLAQIAALGGSTSAVASQTTSSTGSAALPIPSSIAAPSCPNLIRTLYFGATGSDVSQLQQFLSTQFQNFNPDDITGYYGSLTQDAVAEWQSDEGIVNSGSPQTTGWGVAGPQTRAAIAQSCTN